MDGERTGVVDEVLKLGDIARRPNNRAPRKVEQLLEQLVAEGQLNAVLVRKRGGKIPKGDPKPFATYELIGGERRCAALELAYDTDRRVPGLEPGEVRAVIFDVDDAGAARKAAIDNLGREDPTPLEQGEIYLEMLETGACSTVDELAARVGKSAGYVHQRMRLPKLVAALRELLEAEGIEVGAAVAIAQASEAVQKKLAPSIVKQAGPGKRVPRAFVERLLEETTHDLERAPFDRADATLYPEAGPCTTCPKRTGVQQALIDIGDRGDVCLDPDCFGTKSDRSWARTVETAKASPDAGKRKLKVLTDRQAEALMPHGHLVHNSDWIEPDKVISRYDGRPNIDVAKIVTPEMPRALVRDPSSGRAVMLVERAAVDAAVKELDKERAKASPKKKAGKGTKPAPAPKDDWKKKRELEALEGKALLAQVEAKVLNGPMTTAALVHILVARVLRAADLVSAQSSEMVAARRGLQLGKGFSGASKAIGALLEKLSRAAKPKEVSRDAVVLGIEISLADELEFGANGGDVAALAKTLGLDIKAAKTEAAARYAEQSAPKPKAKGGRR